MRGPWRIVCVGNRYLGADRAGPLVHDHLRDRGVPEGVDLIDGGLGGLLLLEIVDGCERVVFVDAISGFEGAEAVVLLEPERAALAVSGHLDHAAGLAWLLRMLPAVCTGPPPIVYVVGLQGEPTPAAIERAAGLALQTIVAPPRGATPPPPPS